MATTQENINIKIGLDTSNFNGSVKGMMNELKALQKIDISILSETEKKQIISRMGELRASIGDIQEEIKRADGGEFFRSFSVLAGPAISAVSGLAVGMQLFGAETEKVDAIQRKLMGVISLLSTLQTLADANKLKGLLQQIPLQAAELKTRITNALLIKQETAAVVAENVAKTTLGKTTGTLTKLQLLWNSAIAANPIGAIIVAVAALAAGIYLLSRRMKENVEVQEQTYTAIDGTIVKSRELLKVQNELAFAFKSNAIERQRISGEISQTDYEELKRAQDFSKRKLEADNEYYTKTEEIEKKIAELTKDRDDTIIVAKKKKLNAELLKLEEEKGAALVVLTQTYQKIQDEENTETLRKNVKYQDDLKKIRDGANDAALKDKIELNNKLKQAEIDAFEDQYKLGKKNIEDILTERELTLRATKAIYTTDNTISSGLSDAEKQQRIDEEQARYDEANEAVNKNKELYDQAYIAIVRKYKNIELDIIKETNTNKLKEQKEFNDLILKNEEANKKEEERIRNEFLAGIKEVNDYRIEQGLITQDELLQQELDALKKSIGYINSTQEEKEIARQNIIDKYTDIEFQKERNKLDYLASIGIDVRKQQQDLELSQLQESLNKQLITEEQYLIAKQALNDRYDIVRDEKQKVINEAIAASFQILTDQIAAREEEDLENLQQYNDEKTKSIDAQLTAGLISERLANQQKEQLAKEIAEREKAIKIKAAKETKALAVFQIAVDTLVAVMKTLATLGPIAGAAVTPFVIASGAISAATILAKPIPQYAKGTSYAEGGMSIVGENGPEIVNVPRGSEVISNKDLSSLLNNRSGGITFEQMKYYIDNSIQTLQVQVSEYEITETQKTVKNVRVNSEVQ